MKRKTSTDTRLQHKASTPTQVKVFMKTHVTKGIHYCLPLGKIIEAIRDNLTGDLRRTRIVRSIANAITLKS
jgi:hypothetical protein